MGTYNDDNPNALDSSGWRTVLFDGFNGTSVDRGSWPNLYGGGTGNGDAFSWSHEDVRVGDGELTISMTNQGGWWTAGGVSQGSGGQTYGRYEVRAKVDPGQGTQGVVLLWPSDNGFPPEVDLLETPEGNRSKAHFTYHWDAGYDAYESHGFDVDTSQWHTYAVDWTADRLTYYIDGREMFSTTSNVPQESMALGFMGWVAKDGQNWYNGGPDETTPWQVNLHVDWAKISVADGASQGGGGWEPEAAPASEEEDTTTTWEAEPEGEEAATNWEEPASGAETTSAWEEESGSEEASWSEPEQVDWADLAARAQANFEATGQWFV